MLELLAPAGDMNKLLKVIEYGADAVYLGLNQFNLRAAGGNFSKAELGKAVQIAHEAKVKVYVALNSLARDHDFPQLRESILAIREASADAVIVTDPGVLLSVKELSPETPIHISTQSSVLNARTARFWYEQGARRIILARELSLEDIRGLRRELPPDLELEAFVHGAMCMSYSGRCILSDYYNARSANRGACTQPCRWYYQSSPLELTEKGHPERPLILEQDQNGSYLLSSSDLCMIEYIPQLAEAGIVSLKIEGRTKSAFYAATVVKAYREAIDSYLKDPANYQVQEKWLRNLEQTVHRHFDTGFYFQNTAKPLAEQQSKIHAEQSMYHEAKVVGEIRGQLENQYLLVEQRNKIERGAEVDLIQPEGDEIPLRISQILDLNKAEIESTPHAKMLYLIPYQDAEQVPVGSYLRQSADK